MLFFMIFNIIFLFKGRNLGGQCWKWEGPGKYHRDREVCFYLGKLPFLRKEIYDFMIRNVLYFYDKY